MADRTPEAQLTKYLTDVHSIEEQALAQLRFAPRIAGDPDLSRLFADHLRETEGHERLVRRQLEERGAAPSGLKDAAGRFGGWGMVMFARMNPDSPGKLAVHAFSFEHMEMAAYQLLRRIAQRAGDKAIAEMAKGIADEERRMADRLDRRWDQVAEASLRAKGAQDVRQDLIKHLRDAHALESQALQLLQVGPWIAGLDPLADVFRGHLEQTREHQRQVD